MSRRLLLATLTLLTIAPSVARAATVAWAFEAQIRVVHGASSLVGELESAGYTAGVMATGVIAFDADTADSSPPDDVGLYWGAITSSVIRVGEYTLGETGTFNRIIVADQQIDAIDASETIVMPGFDGDGSYVFRLEDSTGEIWNSDAMPDPTYSLTDFDPFVPMNGFGTGFYLPVGRDAEFARVEAEILSFTATTVPLPPTLLLLAASIAGLVAGWRRR